MLSSGSRIFSRFARATVVYAQVDRAIGRSWQLRVGAQQRRGTRELVVRPLPGADGQGIFALTGHGTSRAHSLEVTAGYRSMSATQQFYVSYVRSSSIGNLNDLNTVTGPSGAALLLPDARGPLPADVPHRFLAWGIISLPWHLTVAPFLEIRSGFPFSPIDEDWNPAGPRNGSRFPVFASADLAIEKALKVVGIGSVGTRCFIVLMFSEENHPLILQFKESCRSVLEPYAGKSQYENQGQRVVMGQRLMQSSSDIFLGWARGREGRDFFVRQLRDMKMSVPIEGVTPAQLKRYSGVCGQVLARAHAKSGDAATISGYIGKSDVFDEALGDFALAYADQTERDHAALVEAVNSGRLEALIEEE